MTAMCDVAFLLLTFFMLTTKFKSDEPFIVDLPSSVSEVKLPDANIISITITKQNKIFFGIDGKYNREKLIQKIAQQHNIPISKEDVYAFSLTSSFGVPISQLREYLSMDPGERNNENNQAGIPVDSTNNELKEWIKYAKIVAFENSYDMYKKQQVAIRGDGKVSYPIVKNIMNTLQDLQINKFSLITNLEAMPK